MTVKLTHIIFNSLTITKHLTLRELYIIVKDTPGFDWEDSISKHRVRSTIDSLLRTNKIKRIAEGTYALNNQT